MLPRTPVLYKGVSRNQLFVFIVVRRVRACEPPFRPSERVHGVNELSLFRALTHSLHPNAQANLLTGATNLNMRTIEASPFVATCVLSAYMFAVSALATVLEVRGIRIKL